MELQKKSELSVGRASFVISTELAGDAEPSIETRVIGSDGRLVGYGGGLPAKSALLALEQRVAGAPARPVRPRQGALFG